MNKLYCYDCMQRVEVAEHPTDVGVIFEVLRSDDWDATTIGLFRTLDGAKAEAEAYVTEDSFGTVDIQLRHLQ